jgi:tetratricopeptide (TPR) repeat protein
MRKGTRQRPGSESFNQRGIELADRGWLEEAIREFTQAIHEDTDSPYPRINRASVYIEQSRHIDALEDLLSAVKLAPGEMATHYHLGVFLSRFGSTMAISQLQQALTQDPEQIDALIQLGTTLADRGETHEAEKSFRAALEIDHTDPLVNRELGVLMMEKGCIHEAISHLKMASSALSQDVEILVDLGMAYIQAGFYDKAERLFLDVLELEPASQHAHYNLAAIYADRENKDQAIQHLQQAATSGFFRVQDWAQDDRMFDKLRADQHFRQFMETIDPPDVG